MSLPLHVEIVFGDSPEAVRLHWREELRRLDGVEEAHFAPLNSVGRSASGRDSAALDFGKLLLTIAPAAVKAVIGALAGLIQRPGAPPAKLKVKIGGNEIDMEFSSRDLTPEALGGVVERLAASLRPTP